MEVRGGKRFRTKAERRAIVEESFKPGASVSRVARAHDVNANQVFHWRLQYRRGLLDEEPTRTSALAPVKIAGGVVDAQKQSDSAVKRAGQQEMHGTIDIDLGHARVRIEGSADPDCVRATLEGLLR